MGSEAAIGRCGWATSDALLAEYHDLEWGVPLHDDVRLFEMLTLEGAQAGLSWMTILRKRNGYRESFAGFDVQRVAQFGDEDAARLMLNPGIVRNRAKIAATIGNARSFLAVQEEFGSFDSYLWGWTDGAVVREDGRTLENLPARTALSDRISKDLLRRGFKFVGSTIVYSFLQAVGVVDDHCVGCFRYAERE